MSISWPLSGSVWSLGFRYLYEHELATIGLCLDLASVGLCLFDAYGVHDVWGEPWTEILSSERTGTNKKKTQEHWYK